MAQPSSTHRERSSARHHHRTVSSTTILLILSLVLAVLAVMLALPRSQATAPAVPPPESTGGLFGFLSPKRDSALASRESLVAKREAEVARREAEIFGGAPSGVTLGTCLPCATATVMPEAPVTIIREYAGGVETINPPWWKDTDLRAEDILAREAHIAEREKEVGIREDTVGRRESEANRRESWIYENLMAATAERPVLETEEFIIDDRTGDRTGRRTKVPPPIPRRSEV